MIHTLNHVGANFTGFALSMFVQSSLLIVALFLLDLVLRKKVRAVMRYPLWMLLLVKLVLPPSFAVPTSPAYWLPEKKTVKPSSVTTTPVVVHYSEARFVEPPLLQTPPPARPRLQVAAMFLLAWLVIALGLVVWLVRRSHSVARTAARAAPASNSPEELLEACRQQMGIKRRVRLKLSANAGSPAVCGLWRPIILIPLALAEKLTPLQLRAVLFHELAHIQRGDVWVNYAQTLLQIFYWWHPLLWLANARIRRVREQGVDERVMVEMGREAEAYPATLLEVAKLASRHPMPALGLIGILESKSALAQRIRHLLDSPAPKSAKLGFARLAAVALLGAALLPMARGQRPAQPNPGVNAPTAIVSIEVKFVELTDPALEAISLGDPTVTGPNGHRAWVLPPADDLIERMQGQPDTSILYAPSVTTHSGQQAQISVTESQDFNGNVIEAGPVCDLLPEVSGDWIDLSVIVKVTEFGEIVSDQPNGMQLGPKQSDGSGKPEESAVHSVNATGYIIHEAGTARVSVADEGLVVLQNPEVKSINGKRILVLVSPRIVRETASASTPDPNSVSHAGSSSSAARPREETRVLPTPPPKSAQAQPAGSAPMDNTAETETGSVAVRIANTEPYFYLDSRSVSLERLFTELKRNVSRHPAVTLSIRADKDAPTREVVKVADAARKLGIKSILLVTQPTGTVALTKPPEKHAPSVLETDPREPSGKPSPSEAQSDIKQLGFDWFLGNTLMSNGRMGFQGGTAPSFGGAPSLANPAGIFPSPTSPLGAAVTSNSVPLLGNLPFLGPGRKAIQAKLNRIVLPEIGFDNVRLLEAIQWLAKESTDRDPDVTGVNFLVNPNVIGTPQAAIDPNTGQVLSEPSLQPLDMNTVRVRIHPPLRNVRLSEAMEALVRSADKPIRYSIEDYAVIFSQKPPGTNPLETRIFKVDPKTFFEDAHRFLLDAGWSDIDIFGYSNDWRLSVIRKLFESLGVGSVPPNTFFYSYGTGAVMVRATAEELHRVQKAIESLKARKDSANQSPGAAAKVGEDKVNQPDTTEERVVSTRSEPIKLETRVFRVNPAMLLEGLKNTSGVPPNSGTIESIQDSIREFFTAAGVNVQPPNAVFFNDRTGVLMVRATSTELGIVQKCVEMLNCQPPQITIEAKFMELPTEAVRQLGFDLPPPDLASNTWTRILTAAQTRAVLHAAGQFDGVDILSAPRITTLSGRQSQIQAVDIRTVVTGIDPKALTPPGVQSTNGVPAQPYFTSQVSSGPTLDVVPSVGADGYTIHLAALPQVTEFLRYDTTLNGAKETRVWVDGRQQNVPMPVTAIRTRQMKASVDVYDGQTLVLANPQVAIVSTLPTGESVTNAVPEDSGKRLLVFITPTIIDPAGNPIHLPGKEPWADTTPTQRP